MLKLFTPILWLSFLPLLPLHGRTITDMAGREVTIPDRITRILPYDNKANVILFSVAGDLMIAKARTMENPLLKYISKDFLQLKEIDTKNSEEVIKLKPDIIIAAAYTNGSENLANYTTLSTKTGIPMVFIDIELLGLDHTYEFLGQLLGKKQDAETCSNFIKSIYTNTQSLKKNNTTKVYLANDNNGLRTAPANSAHAQLFDVMDLQNVAQASLDAKGFATVSIEQVMIWNPEYIFCIGKGETSPFRTILKSPTWRTVQAVKNRKVFPVPSEPYQWFDMPPSVNRIAGIIWFSEIFYGQSPSITKEKIITFYRIFYKYTLTDSDYQKLFVWK